MKNLRRNGYRPDRASPTELTRRVVYLALGWALTFFSYGCGRSDTSGGVGLPRPRGTVTFCRDVAPIIFKHCSPCHRPNQSGPFDLLSFADVKKRAKEIAQVTSERAMPPWLLEPGYGEFKEERRLREEEIGLIQAWVADGAHVVSVGACRPDQREMAPDLVACSRLFVDSRAAALVESGDVVMGIKEQRFSDAHIAGELGEVVLGRVTGRTSREAITVFKSLGMAVEDVVTADLVFRRAVESGAGTELTL